MLTAAISAGIAATLLGLYTLIESTGPFMATIGIIIVVFGFLVTAFIFADTRYDVGDD